MAYAGEPLSSLAPRPARGRWPARAPSPIAATLLLALLLHAAAGVYDLLHPPVFLNADRAVSRLAAIQGLYEAWASDHVAAYLAAHGIVGDYLGQALILALAGSGGLIAVQVALALLAGYAVFRLGRLLGLPDTLSALACAVYLLLPHTLLFPHQLASEAIYDPLLTIALWLAGEFVAGQRRSLLLASALLLGLASLVRPITLLWPLVVGLLLATECRKSHGLVYFLVALLPAVLWAGFIGVQTGSPGLGKSEHDLGHNLYQRVYRIGHTLPDEEAKAVQGTFLAAASDKSLGVADYLRFGLAYPGPFVKHALRDVAIFVGKPGVERLPIDYFEINSGTRSRMQDARRGWRTQLEREGAAATWRTLWQDQGGVMLLSLAGSLAMLAMIAAAGVGGWQLLSGFALQPPARRFVAAQLVCLPLYLLLFSQVVDAVQSRHRAPAEAALVLLAAAGWARMLALRPLPAATRET